MNRASRPESVILGSGCYSRTASAVFGATLVPDEWLIRRRWGAPTTFSAPLVGCRRVFQVISHAELPARTHWRHDAFWRLYGELGGKSMADLGLKWMLLDCRDYGVEAAPSQFCIRAPAAEGLSAILAAGAQAKSHAYTDWHDSLLAEKEVKIRIEIFRLVRDGTRNEEICREIQKLREKILPLQWERFCPCPPPDDHTLANRIRAWLLRTPDTNSVTPWFMEGESLLRQTTLTP